MSYLSTALIWIYFFSLALVFLFWGTTKDNLVMQVVATILFLVNGFFALTIDLGNQAFIWVILGLDVMFMLIGLVCVLNESKNIMRSIGR